MSISTLVCLIPFSFQWNSTGMTGFLQDSTGIPVDSCGFHWNSTGMTGFLQDSTGIPLDSTGIPLEWPDSCRNRWGTVKYWVLPTVAKTSNMVLGDHPSRWNGVSLWLITNKPVKPLSQLPSISRYNDQSLMVSPGEIFRCGSAAWINAPRITEYWTGCKAHMMPPMRAWKSKMSRRKRFDPVELCFKGLEAPKEVPSYYIDISNCNPKKRSSQTSCPAGVHKGARFTIPGGNSALWESQKYVSSFRQDFPEMGGDSAK